MPSLKPLIVAASEIYQSIVSQRQESIVRNLGLSSVTTSLALLAGFDIKDTTPQKVKTLAGLATKEYSEAKEDADALFAAMATDIEALQNHPNINDGSYFRNIVSILNRCVRFAKNSETESVVDAQVDVYKEIAELDPACPIKDHALKKASAQFFRSIEISLKEKNKKLAEGLALATREKEELTKTVEGTNKSLNDATTSSTHKITEQEQLIAEQRLKLESAQKEMAALTQQNKELAMKLELAAQQSQEQEKNLTKQRQKTQEGQQQIATLTQEKSTLTESNAQLSKDLALQTAAVEEQKKTSQQHQEATVALRQQLENSQQETTASKAELETFKEVNARVNQALVDQMRSTKKESATLNATFIEQQQQLVDAQRQIADLTLQCKQLTESREPYVLSLTNELHATKRENQDLRNQAKNQSAEGKDNNKQSGHDVRFLRQRRHAPGTGADGNTNGRKFVPGGQ